MNENDYRYGGLIDPSTIFTILAVCGVLALIGIVAQWKIFQKAGRSGWASIVPLYNFYVLLKIVGKPGYWMLLMLIPFVNIYFAIKTVHLLSKSFGKDTGFTLGLLFLSFVFYPILAFGDSRYIGPYGDPAAFAAHQEQNRFEFEEAAY
jgi:hypothetical protein